jgi:GT2 family glycosyltransferase
MKVNAIDIVVLNYNGEEILRKCLPSIADAAKNSPVPCQVIVLDNVSTDGSLDYIRSAMPDVHIEVAKANKILFSYNELIPKLKSDVIILLNNDIKVDRDFIAPLISYFADDEVFAVAPKQMNFNGIGYNGGKNKLFMEWTGFMRAGQYMYGDNNPIMQTKGYTHYNANSAFSRKKFLELGGFDDLYYPSTWEDSDLCYRAWKTGWKMIYEPASVIYHDECYTIGREHDNKNALFKARRMKNRRNSYVFTWTNITSPGLLTLHLVLLPLNLFWSLFNDRSRVSGFFDALKYINRIIARRRQRKGLYKVADESILGIE